jgi:microcystin degradation protein MlrC
MRLFAATLATEANAFSPRPTGLASYRNRVFLPPKRTQALGLEPVTNPGIGPRARSILVVKSTNHFMAAFGSIAKRVICVDSDAPLSRDDRQIEYVKVNRPIWPLDENTRPRLVSRLIF